MLHAITHQLMGEDHVAGMSSLSSMPDNAGGADMVDGLVTDPTLFPSWGNPGDQIFKWTDDQGTEYFVTASVFRLFNQPRHSFTNQLNQV